MGPKTKNAIESIVSALREFPVDHHRQLLEWAALITSGVGTMAEVETGRWSWDRSGTWHESAHPDYAPDWSK
jgi:hypothetical protein